MHLLLRSLQLPKEPPHHKLDLICESNNGVNEPSFSSLELERDGPSTHVRWRMTSYYELPFKSALAGSKGTILSEQDKYITQEMLSGDIS